MVTLSWKPSSHRTGAGHRVALHSVRDRELVAGRRGRVGGGGAVVRLLLTTRLAGAAAVRLVHQLLSRFPAGGAGPGGAGDRLALGHHGAAVTLTLVAATGPCLARLGGGGRRAKALAAQPRMWMHRELHVLGVSSDLLGTPVGSNTIWNGEQTTVVASCSAFQRVRHITNVIAHLMCGCRGRNNSTATCSCPVFKNSLLPLAS